MDKCDRCTRKLQFFSSQILAARATSIYANLLEQEKAFT